jgi:hypothetical protein
MTTLKDFATAYVPQQSKTYNIADLPKVSTVTPILTKEDKKKDGTPFSYFYIEVTGVHYRVPKTVIEQLQAIMKFSPDLQHFKVIKTGTTKDDAKYRVEPAV